MNLRWSKNIFIWPLQNSSGKYQTYLALLKIWELEFTSVSAMSFFKVEHSFNYIEIVSFVI